MKDLPKLPEVSTMSTRALVIFVSTTVLALAGCDDVQRAVSPAKKLQGLWTLMYQSVRCDGSSITYEGGPNTGKAAFSNITHSESNVFTAKLNMDDGTQIPAKLTLLNDDTVFITIDTSSRTFWDRPLWAETRMTKVK